MIIYLDNPILVVTAPVLIQFIRFNTHYKSYKSTLRPR